MNRSSKTTSGASRASSLKPSRPFEACVLDLSFATGVPGAGASNPHVPFGTGDFKSPAYTVSPSRRARPHPGGLPWIVPQRMVRMPRWTASSAAAVRSPTPSLA